MVEIPVRYVKQYPEGDVDGLSHINADWDEGRFEHGEASLQLDPRECALALVDFWDSCWHPEPMIPELGWIAELNEGLTFQNRIKQITLEKVVPVLTCARASGLTVVHLPSTDIAVKYPQHQRLSQLKLDEKENFRPIGWQGWPPNDWGEAWRIEQIYRTRPKTWWDMWDQVWERVRIAEPVAPLDDEIVASTGAQFHHICKERKIRTIFYTGFALNVCVLGRPGALYEMRDRGYMTIIIRDCTAAAETAETYNGLWMTKAFIEWLEMVPLAYSATSADFIKAFQT